jgi:hypothetical protein
MYKFLVGLTSVCLRGNQVFLYDVPLVLCSISFHLNVQHSFLGQLGPLPNRYTGEKHGPTARITTYFRFMLHFCRSIEIRFTAFFSRSRGNPTA